KGKEKVSQDEKKGVEARTNIIDKGKKKVSQDETEGVEARTSTVDSDYDSEFDIVDDSEYDSDKSVDYLSPGEEQLIELKNKMKANREAKAKAKGNSVSNMNEPNDENIMPVDNVRGETFEKYDIYMNELLTRLKTTDEDGITHDPFILVEKHVDKSFGKKVVAKCGQRPPRLIVLEKGKQRKQSMYYGFTEKLGVTVNPDDKTYFDRFHVSFAGLEDRWNAWCRKVITLDGYFLKSPNQEEDLGCSRENGLTLMSDHHKGLIEAGKDVMPNAKHRQFARHIYENFKKHYSWFWHVIPAGGNLFKVRSGSKGFTVDEGKKRCKVQSRMDLNRVVMVGLNRVAQLQVGQKSGVSGSKQGSAVAGGSKGCPSIRGSKKGGAVGSKQSSVGAGGLKRGAGAFGSKRKAVSSVGTQKRQVQTQDDLVQIQADPMQTQEQAKIDLTQVEQIQEQTHDQVQTQEQPKQVTLRRPSARILQRKLAKQGSSQNIAFNVEQV
nr:pentatricopeptide repeat-containing protein [Tanacetum cinerariifolium]